MTESFSAVASPDSALLETVSELTPHSPFNTVAYASALSSTRAQPVALIMREGAHVSGGCLAALSGSRWNRKLEIFSAPELRLPTEFWNGVADFCNKQDVCDLIVQTFASISPSLPHFANPINHRQRSEFTMDLQDSDLPDKFSKNHKRSIRKAQKANLKVTRSSRLEDYRTHVELMRASMMRRSHRGENVKMPSAQDFDFALLRDGAGDLFQASSNDQVLASILILKSHSHGYYHSAGTTPEGMTLGASPFLISEVSKTLTQDEYRGLNLGGVDPGADGLRRFKSGFGAEEEVLSAASYSMIPPWNRTLRSIARAAKNAPITLLSRLER